MLYSHATPTQRQTGEERLNPIFCLGCCCCLSLANSQWAWPGSTRGSSVWANFVANCSTVKSSATKLPCSAPPTAPAPLLNIPYCWRCFMTSNFALWRDASECQCEQSARVCRLIKASPSPRSIPAASSPLSPFCSPSGCCACWPYYVNFVCSA